LKTSLPHYGTEIKRKRASYRCAGYVRRVTRDEIADAVG